MNPEVDAGYRLLIRADGSTQIGNGHILRMLALAQAWRDFGGSVTLAFRECPEFVLLRYRQEAVELVQLAPQSMPNEARQLQRIASDGLFDWVALDGYLFDSNYQTIVQMSGCRLLVVDDYQHLERYSADLILNQNIDARDDVYQTLAPGIPVLAGLNFVLLRREFCNALPSVDNASVTLQSCENQDRRESVHLLITLGGTDLQDLSTLILAAIEPLVESYSLQVRLLKGADNQKRSAWESMEPKPGWLNVLADVSEMVPQYRWADLAIVGGGSSNWELCCFGIPRLVIVLAENQVAIARGLERAGVAINLGDCRELTSTKFSQALIQLLENSAARQTQSRRSRGLVDGQGAKRVVNYLLGMAATSKSVRQTQLAENVSGINLNRRQT